MNIKESEQVLIMLLRACEAKDVQIAVQQNEINNLQKQLDDLKSNKPKDV